MTCISDGSLEPPSPFPIFSLPLQPVSLGSVTIHLFLTMGYVVKNVSVRNRCITCLRPIIVHLSYVCVDVPQEGSCKSWQSPHFTCHR